MLTPSEKNSILIKITEFILKILTTNANKGYKTLFLLAFSFILYFYFQPFNVNLQVSTPTCESIAIVVELHALGVDGITTRAVRTHDVVAWLPEQAEQQ